MHRRTPFTITLLACFLLWPGNSVWAKPSVYVKDMDFALDELEEACGHFFKAKGIQWKKVRKAFAKEAKAVTSDEEHMLLMVRLLARLKDGHAAVRPLQRGDEIPVHPSFKERLYSPGMYWCRVGKKVYVKVSGSEAEEVGIEPGFEILKADDQPVLKWLDARIETLRDRHGFSTDHQALFYACHWGLSGPQGSRFEVQFKTHEGKTKKRTITIHRARAFVEGPAHFPLGLKRTKDLKYGKTGDLGYIHVRRCKSSVVEQMDEALAGLGAMRGLVLDFRGNSGGGFDHEALMGRFIPEGKSLTFKKRYQGAGPARFGGPVVVIVDGTTVSAGETASGIFKEDGRAYMIGESPTAGMSASKKLIALPSGLFGLYVAVASNMGRFNKGAGIEGLGVVPHETVAFDPDDLAEKKDTLILRAFALLEDFPQKQVPYIPAKFGWSAE